MIHVQPEPFNRYDQRLLPIQAYRRAGNCPQFPPRTVERPQQTWTRATLPMRSESVSTSEFAIVADIERPHAQECRQGGRPIMAPWHTCGPTRSFASTPC